MQAQAQGKGSRITSHDLKSESVFTVQEAEGAASVVPSLTPAGVPAEGEDPRDLWQ
jgi:hypothetical protein